MSDIEQMKYFMSVGLLTTVRGEYSGEESYDGCIESSSKRYF